MHGTASELETVKMRLLFMFLLVIETRLGIANNNGELCCYFYGSVPRNDTNCVRAGGQLTINIIIYNPRDNFTNLTVRWFRWNDITQSIKQIQGEYEFSQYTTRGLTENITCGTVYRDSFTLRITRFTREKDGYYWCQIVLNGTFLQPSPYAWFYADHSNSPCEQQEQYFQPAKAQCANATYPTIFPPIITMEMSVTVNNSMSTTAAVMELTEPNIIEPIFYAVGVLSVLVLSLVILAIFPLLMLARKRQIGQKQRKQRKGNSRQEEETTIVNTDTTAVSSSVSNTLIHVHEQDPIISVRGDDIYSIVSDASLGGVTTRHRDSQQDHTYDAAEFHSQTHSNELPEYNTLQHGNAANTQIDSNSVPGAYDKIDISTSKDLQKHSKLTKQLQRNTYTTDAIRKHDDVVIKRPNETMPGDYEPVYHGTHVDKPTDKHVLFDDETYGVHKPASKGAAVQPGVDGVESTPHSETISTVKKELLTPDKEVEYAEPLPPNANSHAQEAQATDEHFYHSLEHNEQMKAEKCISGVPYSKESSNPVMKNSTFAPNSAYISEVNSPQLALKDQATAYAMCQTQTLTSLYDSTHAMDEVGTTLNDPILFNIDQCQFDDPMYEGISHSVPKQADKNPPLSIDLLVHKKMQTGHYASTPEEESCTGDLNDNPELINHKEYIRHECTRIW